MFGRKKKVVAQPGKKLFVFPLHAVQCLHCGHPNDCREIYSNYLANFDWEMETQLKEKAYAQGRKVTSSGQPQISCDRCGQSMTIVKVDKSPRLVVRK